HGRDHDERQVKAARPRANNLPGDESATDLEAELSLSGRGGMAPREGVVGAHEGLGRETVSAAREEGEEPAGSGRDVAPTAQAAPIRRACRRGGAAGAAGWCRSAGRRSA